MFSTSRVESNKALVNLIGDMGQIRKDTRSGNIVSQILKKLAEQSEIYLPKIDDKLDCYFVSRLARGLTRLNQQPEPSFHSFMEQSTIQLHKSGAFDAYLAKELRSKTSKLDKVSPFPIYFQKYRNAGEKPDGKATRGTIDSNVDEAL